jgi:hypothetical protein
MIDMASSKGDVGECEGHRRRCEVKIPEASASTALSLVPSPTLSVADRIARLMSPDPERRRAQYDGAAADALADVAAWSYSDCVTLMTALEHRGVIGPGATCLHIAVKNEPLLVVATGFFIRSGNVGVLSFRGTELINVVSWLTDASVQPKNFLSMGRVHGGFQRNLRAIWDDLAASISAAVHDQDERRRLRALYITGHSLGGAMAVVAAATIFGDDRFAEWRPLIRGIYTYGQPMVGDREFARSCEARFGDLLFRHVYAHDLVPRMPPWTTGVFRHSGNEYAGSADGWTPREKPVAQAASALMSVPVGAAAYACRQLPLLNWIKFPFSIDDHLPNNYLEAFRAMRSDAAPG